MNRSGRALRVQGKSCVEMELMLTCTKGSAAWQDITTTGTRANATKAGTTGTATTTTTSERGPTAMGCKARRVHGFTYTYTHTSTYTYTYTTTYTSTYSSTYTYTFTYSSTNSYRWVCMELSVIRRAHSAADADTTHAKD